MHESAYFLIGLTIGIQAAWYPTHKWRKCLEQWQETLDQCGKAIDLMKEMVVHIDRRDKKIGSLEEELKKK